MDAMRNAPLTTTTVDPNTSTPSPTRAMPVPSGDVGLAVTGAPPPPSEGVKSNMPPVRVTYGPQGLSGVDALMAQRGAMQENPFSKVSTNAEGQAEIAPPKPERHGFKGTLKNIGEGVLSGLALADPDNPNAILGSAIGGGVTAGVNRSAGPQLHHRFDMNVLDNDIARGLKLEQEQAQLGSFQADARNRALQPAFENAKLELERDRLSGLIDEHTYQRKKDELEFKEKQADRASREKTSAANNEATVEAAKIRAAATGSTNPQKIAENQAKREAKINESAALYKKADALVEEAKKLHGQPDPYGDVAKRIESYEKEARDLRKDGDKARSEGESIPEQQAAPSASGVTLEGAIGAFKRDAKRDPTPDEIANIKKHYGLQ